LASGLEKSALGRIAIPVGLTFLTINAAQTADKIVRDLQKGHFSDAVSKGLNSQLAKGISGGLSKALDDALHGNFSKILRDSPLSKIPGVGGLIPGGGLSGKLAPDFGKTAAAAKDFWGTLDDRVRIAHFQDSLKNADNLLNSNTNSLQGNSQGAKSNREGLTKLVVEAEAAAHAYANTTGKQSDYTNALRLAIPQIEDAAAATGLNRAQVDKLVTSILGVPLQTENEIQVKGYLDALNAVNNYLIAISKIPPFVTTYINAVATGTTQSVPGGTQGTFGGLFGAGSAGQIPHPAAGGLIHGPGTGTSDSIPAMVSNGEYVVRADAVKQYGVGFFHALNAQKFASGGHVDALKYLASHKKVAAYLEAVNARQAALSNPGASGLLQDLSILGNYTHAQNQILGYNRANFAHATAANVPGLENAAKNAAAVAHAVGAYFNAHKAALFTAAHSGSATQRKAAGSLYNELASFAHITSSDAAQEASLAAQLRRRYAGPEAGALRFGAASQDLSYLALSRGSAGSGNPTIHVTVVSKLDGKEVARNTSQHQVDTEKFNLSNGATRLRIR
jgi:hypothetical protein